MKQFIYLNDILVNISSIYYMSKRKADNSIVIVYTGGEREILKFENKGELDKYFKKLAEDLAY